MLAAAAASAPAAFAENYADENSIYYSYNTETKTASVADPYGTAYSPSGDVVIPESITVDGVDYILLLK